MRLGRRSVGNLRCAIAPTAGKVAGMDAPPGFEIDDNPQRIDRDAVWAALSTEVYWDLWRERSHVEAQLDSAWRVVGAYELATGQQVGFARAISDGVSFAYLADVVVTGRARGIGLGKALVTAMIERGPGAEFEWLLHQGRPPALRTVRIPDPRPDRHGAAEPSRAGVRGGARTGP